MPSKYTSNCNIFFLEHFHTGTTTVGHINGAPVHDSTMISMVDMVDKETPLANMGNHLT